MEVITFFDLLQQETFRNFVSNRLASASVVPYSFSPVLPKLYQYKPLSKYVVDDICSGYITATSIGEFNDLFDGAFHQYGTEEERTLKAEKEWNEIEALRTAAHIQDTLLDYKSFVDLYKDYYLKDSRIKFRMLDFLGTYVSCFSSDNNSILMWSHYAKSNTGICVEYDFNTLPTNPYITKSIFPVCYTNSPVYLSDLLDDKNNKIFRYPLDAAVLCAALNKSNLWSYEKEWRLVYVLPFVENLPRRLPIITKTIPSKIYFGYHFLRPLFYYSDIDYEDAKNNIKQLMQLIDYMEKNSIEMCVMMPSIGQYLLKPIDVKIEKIKQFLIRKFDDSQPEKIRYYHTIHDEFKDLFEE